MQIVRTIVGLLVTAVVVTFTIINWGNRAQINIWINARGEGLGFDWPVALIAFVFFLLGLVPMWLLHKGTRWRFKRRISALENTVKAATVSTPTIATTTQLDSAAQDNQTPAP